MECCVVPMALSKIPGLFEGNLTNRLSEQATEIANIVSHDCKFNEYNSEKMLNTKHEWNRILN